MASPVPWDFTRHLFWQFPAPVSPATGSVLWERGIRFHGAQRAFMASPAKFKQMRGGVRSGKSFITAADLWVDVMWRWQTRVYDDLYWVIGPTYDQAEEEMNHLRWMFETLEIPCELHEPRKESWRLSFPHRKTVVETKTGSDARRIAGKSLRKVAMVEAHQMGPDVWRAARERVLQSRGGVTINGTFEPSEYDWFRELAEEWPKLGAGAMGESFPLPTWDNIVLFPGGREDPVIRQYEEELTPAEFMERLGGEPAVASDLVLPQAMEKFHVGHRFPHLGTSFDPEKPVVLFSDPGVNHAYAVLAAQIWKNVVWIIDAVYRWGRGVEQIAKECAARPWAKRVEMHVMDFAARQRRAEGPPVIEQWKKLWPELTGNTMWCYAEQVPLMPGYERHRKALLNGWPELEAQKQFNADGMIHGMVTNPSGPRVMFAPEAKAPFFGPSVDGKAFVGEYRMHRNKKNNQGFFIKDEPVDMYNDAIKALNYGLYWHFGASDVKHELYKLWEHGAPEIEWRISYA